MRWHQALSHYATSGEAYVIATVVATTGSAPRPAGTKMVITANCQQDTLGGGQLEHLVIARARDLLAASATTQHLEHFPLAAAALQCCGGSVTVLLECFAASSLRVAVFGAGHVGKRVVRLLEELSAQVCWFDNRPEFLNQTSAGQDAAGQKPAPQELTDPLKSLAELPKNTQIVIVSHDHLLDYALLEAVLTLGVDRFAGVGMIGSATKWQRFSARLAAAGFPDEDIARVRTPLGAGSATDKQPTAIAIAIVNELLNLSGENEARSEELQTRPSSLSWQQIKSTLVQS